MSQQNSSKQHPTALRIVTRISPGKNTTPSSPELHNIYHWDRIIGASVLAVLAIIGISYLTFNALSNTTDQ